MKINEGYPSPKKLKDNDLATLKYIKDNSYFWEHYSTLAYDANLSFPKFIKTRSLSFESSLEICLDRKSRKMGVAHVGSNIIINKNDQYEQVSYSLTICSRNNERLLRRYHFDYAHPEEIERQPHPVFHLQYAGKLSENLRNCNIIHKHIDSWLSEPRLCFMPMSLALLINIIFKEFQDENSFKVIARDEWRSLIKKNEIILLAPYFKCCHHFINEINNTKLLTNDFYYGN